MLFPARWTRQFTRQLALLLEEGIPLHEALDVIRMQQRGRAGRRLVSLLRAELENGARLSRVLSLHPRQFKPHYVQTVRWAEETGSVDQLALALRLLAGDTAPRPHRTVPLVDPVTGFANWR